MLFRSRVRANLVFLGKTEQPQCYVGQPQAGAAWTTNDEPQVWRMTLDVRWHAGHCNVEDWLKMWLMTYRTMRESIAECFIITVTRVAQRQNWMQENGVKGIEIPVTGTGPMQK